MADFSSWYTQDLRPGRTSKMLLEAIEKACGGEKVIVVAATAEHAEQLRRRLLEYCHGEDKVSDLISVKPYSVFEREKRFYPGIAVLVDHYVRAGGFTLLHQWREFDATAAKC